MNMQNVMLLAENVALNSNHNVTDATKEELTAALGVAKEMQDMGDEYGINFDSIMNQL